MNEILISLLASLIMGFPAWPVIMLIGLMLAAILCGIIMMIRLR